MKSKPIRYWQNQKIYQWGCPNCDYITFIWEHLFLHSKEEHNHLIGDYHDPPNDYILKEKK